MTKRKTTTLMTILAALVAVLLGLRWWSNSGRTSAPGAPGAAPAAAPALTQQAVPSIEAVTPAEPAALPADLAKLVAYLRGRFGKHIDNPYVQIQMLEQLMRYFQEHNPDGWQADLLAAVRAAFPERYAQIAANLQHRIDYERWVKDNRDYLQRLGDKERGEALWNLRKRLFGDEAAEQIWASELRNQAVVDALKGIDTEKGLTLSDRLSKYKDSLQEVYQEHADTFLQNHRQEALSRFLDLDSVQQDLSALDAAAREAALRDIRKGLGLDKDALQRWEVLDHERDARWDTGKKYMEERATLAAKYQGQALETQLGELRTRYFGAEAESIAQEEESGFFRFNRPRKWGQN
ncbi:MAG TPA: hypothetical protein VH877_32920 [Polyangia bacterium]|jgi:hypothetical protein|nr:hypothetical protein [Polyangia bacterium]